MNIKQLVINSFINRIFVASITLFPLLLGFSAYMLDRAHKASLYNAEKQLLLAQMYGLLAIAEPKEKQLVLPATLLDPRFNTPDSGLYAAVKIRDDARIWESTSLNISFDNTALENQLNTLKDSRELPTLSLITIDQQTFFYLSFDTIWEIDGQDIVYQFVILHTQNTMMKAITTYRQSLIGWLGGLALLLIIVQAMVMRWGLKPLGYIAKDIQRLQSGAIATLDEHCPKEIVPVIQSINKLLENEQNQRIRYKNTLADLAHSLKTPLSVMRSLIDGSRSKTPCASEIDEQIDRMSAIIRHQLSRASTKSTRTFHNPVELAPVFDRLIAALSKVYHDKNVSTKNLLNASTTYAGEESDLTEVFGNLLENAYKYCDRQVQVRAEIYQDELIIIVEDDGVGVDNQLKEEILKRGTRADQVNPGQGIGLSVVVDILSSYDAGLAVEVSPLGGAAFRISFPTPVKTGPLLP